MMKYSENLPLNKSEALERLSSNNAETIGNTLVSISLNEEDWKWAQDICLKYLWHENHDISGLAATCLGHIARIHRKLDKEVVTLQLKSRLNDTEISGRVEDALNDIEMFLK